MRIRLLFLAFCLAAGLLLSGNWALISTAQHSQKALLTVTPSVTASPTYCPRSTPEPLWVEPVQSPTSLLTQTIMVRLGNGEAVTVTTESGVFTTTGMFSAYGNPALPIIALLPNTTHHLTVYGRVRKTEWGGCQYGGYTLSTGYDRNQNPLIIEQISVPGQVFYLPLLWHAESTVIP